MKKILSAGERNVGDGVLGESCWHPLFVSNKHILCYYFYLVKHILKRYYKYTLLVYLIYIQLSSEGKAMLIVYVVRGRCGIAYPSLTHPTSDEKGMYRLPDDHYAYTIPLPVFPVVLGVVPDV